MSLSAVDWIMLVVLAASAAIGAWRGLVFEVLSVAGWIAAFIAAQWFSPQLAAWLPITTSSEPMRHVAAFALIFVLIVFAAGFLAWLVKKMVEAVGLRPIDRVLGAMFGVLRAAVLLLAATVVVGMTPLGASAAWKESAGAPILVSWLKALKPVLPEKFGKYLP